MSSGSLLWLSVRRDLMLADLAVLVPSRGRPENLARLINAIHETSRGRTHVIAGVDEDDHRLKDYIALRKEVLHEGDAIITSAHRRNLVQWTNHLAKILAGDYNYYASLGDDMIPRTKGWDTKLWGAIEEDFNGTGISYPWDGLRDDIPEAYVLSCDIPEMFGWVMLPTLNHWYNDNVIADLGHGASCIRHLRGVIMDHWNVATGKGVVDQTAIDQGTKIGDDKLAYEEWVQTTRLTDVQRLKDLRGMDSD